MTPGVTIIPFDVVNGPSKSTKDPPNLGPIRPLCVLSPLESSWRELFIKTQRSISERDHVNRGCGRQGARLLVAPDVYGAFRNRRVLRYMASMIIHGNLFYQDRFNNTSDNKQRERERHILAFILLDGYWEM